MRLIQTGPDLSPKPRPRDVDPAELLAHRLRRELASRLHMGTLHPGDRLPSIRAEARARGMDHRIVARAYRQLEEEGHVEVVERSGVRVAAPKPASPASPAPSRAAAMPWIVSLLARGWQQGISTEQLADLVRQTAAPTGLVCACVESNVDQMTAYCAEVEAATGILPRAVYVHPSDREPLPESAARLRLQMLLRDADLVVTTQYHAAAVRSVLQAPRQRCVLLRINPELADAVRQRIRGVGLLVVSVSAEFGARMRLMYQDVLDRPSRMRLVLVGDPLLSSRLASREPVLITRAAAALLPPDVDPPRITLPPGPALSADTLEELAESLVQLRLAGG